MRTPRSIINANSSTKKGLSTMGYLTMIVALVPGVAAFSRLQQPVQKALPANSQSYSFDPTELSRWSSRRDTSISSSRTELYYISGANHDYTKHTPDREGSSWWNAFFRREQSSAADEYLEFLDRRYNRILHDDSEKDDSKGFSVMNWLYQGSNGGAADAAKQRQNEDDALYVLGVAGMASEEFKRKHHLVTPTAEKRLEASKKPDPALVTDAEIVEDEPDGQKTVPPAVALLRQVAHRREVFVKSQARSARVALLFVLRSILTGPVKAARKLFIMGGGKKSMAVTLAAMAALSILLRPLLKVAANEGANVISP